MTPYTEISGR